MLNDDRHLLDLIADGDVKSLGILYVLYAARIRNFAFSLLQNSSEAEDITQDLFLKIWNSRESLRNVDSLKSYLFSMTHNSVLNYIKHKNVQDKYKVASAGMMSEQYEPDGDVKSLGILYVLYAARIRNFDTSELLKNIDYALDEMSVLRKTIFRMNRYEHKTYQEIADILMISPKTVQYHISCALSELRKLL